MRYSFTPQEYRVLYNYLLKHAPGGERAMLPDKYEKIIKESDDYNAQTMRITLRLFGAAYTGLRLWEYLMPKIFARGKPVP
jgi:hypothetical protein